MVGGGRMTEMHMKHNLSKQHLWAAEFFAGEAQALEATIPAPDEPQRVKHRAHVTAAILSAVAFVEASINEFYVSAIDHDVETLPTFDDRLFQLFAQFWEDVKCYSILHKYQIALLLAGKDRFPIDRLPYQDAASVVKLRDCLVH
jgi:hypothetical protein